MTMQFGLIGGRQKRIEQWVERLRVKLSMSSGNKRDLLTVLDRLSNPENSAVLDAVCEIAGEKRGELTIRNINERLNEERRRSKIE